MSDQSVLTMSLVAARYSPCLDRAGLPWRAHVRMDTSILIPDWVQGLLLAFSQGHTTNSGFNVQWEALEGFCAERSDLVVRAQLGDNPRHLREQWYLDRALEAGDPSKYLKPYTP